MQRDLKGAVYRIEVLGHAIVFCGVKEHIGIETWAQQGAFYSIMQGSFLRPQKYNDQFGHFFLQKWTDSPQIVEISPQMWKFLLCGLCSEIKVILLLYWISCMHILLIIIKFLEFRTLINEYLRLGRKEAWDRKNNTDLK